MKKAVWIGVPVLLLIGTLLTVGRPSVPAGSITNCQFCGKELQRNVSNRRVWWFQKPKIQVAQEKGCCQSCSNTPVEVKWGRVIYCQRCNHPRKYEVKRKKVPRKQSGQYRLVPVTSGFCPKCKGIKKQPTPPSTRSSESVQGFTITHQLDFVTEHINQFGETVYKYQISGTVRNNTGTTAQVPVSARIYNEANEMIEAEGCPITVPPHGTATFSIPDWKGDLAKVTGDQRESFYLPEYPARYEVTIADPWKEAMKKEEELLQRFNR